MTIPTSRLALFRIVAGSLEKLKGRGERAIAFIDTKDAKKLAGAVGREIVRNLPKHSGLAAQTADPFNPALTMAAESPALT